jgi:hypothetical protein
MSRLVELDGIYVQREMVMTDEPRSQELSQSITMSVFLPFH